MEIQRVFKDFDLVEISETRISDYVSLFRECFPNFNVDQNYLRWLYFENPLGNVVGFDAIFEDEIVGHYACIPIRISGVSNIGLLSLNTATSPRFQGRGLFRVLAENTFAQATRANFSCIVGVANSNSFQAFIRHLKFEHLGNLDLRFGNLERERVGARIYSNEEISWRVNSPLNKFTVKYSKDMAMLSVPLKFGLKIKSYVPVDFQKMKFERKRRFGLTVDWRKSSNPRLYLPKRFKPSPLALIFRSLDGTDSNIVTSWSFPDFDAF